MNQGHITVITGPMFAGKTEELIRRAKSVTEPLIFKHRIDSRYEREFLVSHSGEKLEAMVVEKPEEILSKSSKTGYIFIDEVQFFPLDLINTITKLQANNFNIVLSGLDFDFKGQPFILVHQLSELADEVVLLNSVCSVCGGNAVRSQRLSNGKAAPKTEPVFVVGGNDIYQPRCLNCFKAA